MFLNPSKMGILVMAKLGLSLKGNVPVLLPRSRHCPLEFTTILTVSINDLGQQNYKHNLAVSCNRRM